MGIRILTDKADPSKRPMILLSPFCHTAAAIMFKVLQSAWAAP
jgi:hypothetical protein